MWLLALGRCNNAKNQQQWIQSSNQNKEIDDDDVDEERNRKRFACNDKWRRWLKWPMEIEMLRKVQRTNKNEWMRLVYIDTFSVDSALRAVYIRAEPERFACNFIISILTKHWQPRSLRCWMNEWNEMIAKETPTLHFTLYGHEHWAWRTFRWWLSGNAGGGPSPQTILCLLMNK